MKQTDKFYFGLFNSWTYSDPEYIDEMRKELAECNDMELDEVPDSWIYEQAEFDMDCEKTNLNKETGGYIIALADLGFWNGRRTGYKKIGTNVNEIFDSYLGGDDCEWYADKYNVRATVSHHDGTHYIVFRYVDTYEEMLSICDKIYDGRIKTETDFFKVTKSIRPFIARIYGWKQYGRHATRLEYKKAA